MKVTEKHYQFWVERKAPVSWYHSDKPKVSIHDLIPQKEKFDTATHNMVTLTAMIRRSNKDLKTRLAELARYPGTTHRPEKRASLARKWLRNLGVEVPKADRYETHMLNPYPRKQAQQ